MLIDWPPTVHLKLIMGLDISDRPPKCPTLGMVVIRVADMMLMIDQTKVSILQLHIMDVPDMTGIIADQRHIIDITMKYFLSIDCSSSVVNILTTSFSAPPPIEHEF